MKRLHPDDIEAIAAAVVRMMDGVSSSPAPRHETEEISPLRAYQIRKAAQADLAELLAKKARKRAAKEGLL